jgi:hypothetical protein
MRNTTKEPGDIRVGYAVRRGSLASPSAEAAVTGSQELGPANRLEQRPTTPARVACH